MIKDKFKYIMTGACILGLIELAWLISMVIYIKFSPLKPECYELSVQGAYQVSQYEGSHLYKKTYKDCKDF